MDRYIRPPSHGAGKPPTANGIAQWEAENRLTLPDDYKQFMLRYNGGGIFPEFFPTNYPDDHDFYNEMDEVMQFNYLYPWEELVEKNSYNSDWNQTEFVTIGSAVPGDVLMRLAEPNRGSVHLWWRNNNAWDDEDDPPITGTIAHSLTAFLFEALHPVGEFGGRWHHPKTFERARKLEL